MDFDQQSQWEMGFDQQSQWEMDFEEQSQWEMDFDQQPQLFWYLSVSFRLELEYFSLL